MNKSWGFCDTSKYRERRQEGKNMHVEKEQTNFIATTSYKSELSFFLIRFTFQPQFSLLLFAIVL